MTVGRRNWGPSVGVKFTRVQNTTAAWRLGESPTESARRATYNVTSATTNGMGKIYLRPRPDMLIIGLHNAIVRVMRVVLFAMKDHEVVSKDYIFLSSSS